MVYKRGAIFFFEKRVLTRSVAELVPLTYLFTSFKFLQHLKDRIPLQFLPKFLLRKIIPH